MGENTLRVMTFNIGGGARELDREGDALLSVIREARPDLLGPQEVIRYTDADGVRHDPLEAIGGYHSHYSPTLSLADDFHPGKDAMTAARAAGYEAWEQGNAILSRVRFIELLPDIRLFDPPAYLGNRDTDPRSACGGLSEFNGERIWFTNLHLTTLRFERGPEIREGIAEVAAKMRLDQVKRFIEAVKPLMTDTIILTGDFNAIPDEACMGYLENCGFKLLLPENPEIGTHPKVPLPIDHILVYPADKVEGYTCRIIDTPEARRASDHLPVFAEISLR